MRHVFATTKRILQVAGLCLLASVVAGEQARAQGRHVVEKTLTEADWATAPVAPGVVWKRVQLNGPFGLPQSLNVLDIDLTSEDIEVDVALPEDTGRVKTSALAEGVGAVAAVNGSFFNVSSGVPVVFSQSDGRLVEPSPSEIPSFRNEAAVATKRDGDAVVIRKAGREWARLSRFEDVLGGGPLLVWEGGVEPFQAEAFNFTHHPRTALGVTEERHLILATVDGRTGPAAGMTIQELAWTMQGLGCVAAVNLDGGGSTTMWIQGRGVVNYPSDNEAFDHEGERAVSNAVVVLSHRTSDE